MWVYYQHFPAELATEVLNGSRKAEDILPYFIITVLPTGLTGLVISAALAAAMSSLSSSINAFSMVWVNDIYRPYVAPAKHDGHYLKAGRLTSLVMAILMAFGAWLLLISSTKTIMEMSIILLALVGGGISGAFLFGIMTRWGDARTVLIGIGATLAFTLYATLMQAGVLPRTFSPYYTSILGNLVMFATCVVASRFWPAEQRDLTDLTVWTRKPPAKSE